MVFLDFLGKLFSRTGIWSVRENNFPKNKQSKSLHIAEEGRMFRSAKVDIGHTVWEHGRSTMLSADSPHSPLLLVCPPRPLKSPYAQL